MFGRYLQLGLIVTALGAAVLSGCGDDSEAPLKLEIDTSQLALIPEPVAIVRIGLFGGKHDCEVLRLSGPTVMPPLSTDVNKTDGRADVFDIIPGSYTVDAWGFDLGANALAFGCRETPVTIEDGKQTALTITLMPR